MAKASSSSRRLPVKEMSSLLKTLQIRFRNNMGRHKGLKWEEVEERLETHPIKLPPLMEMEDTGGEPDVIGKDKSTGEIIFCDCSAESPAGRRSLCYDHEALEKRKEQKPKDSAVNMATSMGIEMLTEEQYRDLQRLGEFDRKTSSWIRTPDAIRNLGGALFCDRRYGHVFTYHNGAGSYYAARGFRGIVRI